MSLASAGVAAAALAVLALVLSRSPGPRWTRMGHPDLRALRESGWDSGLLRWELIRAAAVLTASAGALLLGLTAWLIAVAVVAPSVWIRFRAAAARTRGRRALTRVGAGVEAMLRSGGSLSDALRREAAACTDPIARRTLVEVLRMFDLGEGLDIALRRAAPALYDRRSVLLLQTLAIGVEERLSSARLVGLLAEVLDRLHFEERLEEEIGARIRGIRQQQWILALLVPAMALVLIGSLPSLATELQSALGRFVLIPGAVALELGGIALAQRIVRDATA